MSLSYQALTRSWGFSVRIGINRHCPVGWGKRILVTRSFKHTGKWQWQQAPWEEKHRALRARERNDAPSERSARAPEKWHLLWCLKGKWKLEQKGEGTVFQAEGIAFTSPLAWGSLASVRNLENVAGLCRVWRTWGEGKTAVWDGWGSCGLCEGSSSYLKSLSMAVPKRKQLLVCQPVC